MPFLSRKRKREVNGSTISSTASSVNTSDVEVCRTDDTSRLSSNVLSDISLNQNFNKSQSQRSNQVLVENEEPMETQEDDHFDEQLSNRWADDSGHDLNLSNTEPTETQFERKITGQRQEEVERAKLNVAECGTLESITLVNFMCHSHFHLDLGNICPIN